MTVLVAMTVLLVVRLFRVLTSGVSTFPGSHVSVSRRVGVTSGVLRTHIGVGISHGIVFNASISKTMDFTVLVMTTVIFSPPYAPVILITPCLIAADSEARTI